MFAEKLKLLRRLNNMTQVEFAQKFNIATGTIAMWETSKRQPDMETMKRIADFFNVSINYLTDNDAEYTEISTARNIVKKLYSENDIEINIIEEKLGTNYNTFRAWINGYGDYFNSVVPLSKIAELFSVSLDYLLGRTDTPTPVNSSTESLSDTESKLLDNYRSLDNNERQEVLNFIRFKKTQRRNPFTSSNPRSFTTADFEDNTERIAAFGGVEENDDEPLTT